jgi:hypothetical protein
MTTAEQQVTKRIEKRRASQLTVDPRVQRPLVPARVDKIASDFDWLAFGVPTVSQRENDTCIVLDGSHRVEALRALGLQTRTFDVTVYRGLTLVQEAKMFSLLNDAKKPSPLEIFNVRVTMKDPLFVKCDQLIRRAGYVPENGKKNSFKAVSTLLRAYSRDPLSADRAVIVATAAWGIQRSSVDSRLIAGLAELFFRYGDAISLDSLVERLRRGEQTDADSIVGRARTNAKVRSISMTDAVADIIVGIYNYRRQRQVLPSWVTNN